MRRRGHHTGVRGSVSRGLHAEVGRRRHGEAGHWGKGAVRVCRAGHRHRCMGLRDGLIDADVV